MAKNKNEIVDLGNGIYQIKYFWLGIANVYCFLVVGSERALMIDTCYSTTHALEYARKVTNLPITLVNTHGHFDHIGGNADFDRAYLAKEDWETAKEHSDFGQLSAMMKRYRKKNKLIGLLLCLKNFKEPMEASLHILPCRYEQLPKCGYFNLGNRKVLYLVTPGHTKGSTCFFDDRTGYFFTGDMACQEGVLLAFDYSTTVAEYMESIRKMKEYYTSHGGKQILPSHHSLPAREDVFDRLILVCEKIISGGLKGKAFDDGLSKGLTVTDDGITINYRRIQ